MGGRREPITTERELSNVNSYKINIYTLIAFTGINTNDNQSKNTKEDKMSFTIRNKRWQILTNKFNKRCARTMKKILKNTTKEYKQP